LVRPCGLLDVSSTRISRELGSDSVRMGSELVALGLRFN
jgi:hypothetical protein